MPTTEDPTTTRVLRLRLKDRHASYLRTLAAQVNFVWNFCNETSLRVFERERRFVSAYDLDRLTCGATKAGLALHSQTVQAISAEYATRRKQHKKVKLRWRVSDPKRANRSLGWVPFKKSAIRYKSGQVHLVGVPLSLWDSYGLADYALGAGSISEDARGRWYLNVSVKVQQRPRPAAPATVEALGIDLGLKEMFATSEGVTVQAQRFYRDLQPALARAQRSNNTRRTRALHARIANRRRDFLHKHSTALVRQHGAIFVGDVNASALAKTRAAKSVLDAEWSTFRTMLQYKCDDAGRWFKEIDERFSTQDCSACGARAGPQGLAQLGVRRWTCPLCGTDHERDVNAARNIRARGLVWLESQFAAAGEAKAREAVVNEAAQAAAVGHDRPAVGIPVL